MIRHLKHNQIDKKRWDDCVTRSNNGLVYALSWYLDIVSPCWEALIDGDYLVVMPLTVKRKYGIPLLIQPSFTQQLGVFSNIPLTSEVVCEFISLIPNRFVKTNISLNGSFLPDSSWVSKGVNIELDLNSSYSDIYKRYNDNTKRNIKKANNISLHKLSTSSEFIAHFQKCSRHRLTKDETTIIVQIIDTSIQLKQAEAIVAKNDKGEVLAGTFWIISLKRIIYLLSFTSSEGQAKSATFKIIDSQIQQYANSGYCLDFEGSKIEGVARFFKGFGGETVYFQRYRKWFFE